jgi:hypothetical protein
MNRRLFALLIPLALAGCATTPRASADDGLAASMHPAQRGVRVTLSEPAYVAIFEVLPGERVSLYYPAAEGDPARIAAGRTTLRRSVQPTRSYAASYYRGWRAPLLFMVASRQPLDDALIRNMREELGTLDSELFRSYDAGATMERLAALVVPAEQPETEWETYVLLPADRRGRFAGNDAPAPEPTNRNCPGSSVHIPTPDGRICERPVRQGDQRPAPPPLPGGNPVPGKPREREN